MAADQVVKAFALQQFLITFLLLPGYIPLAIASYSIVGEKQTRSLEAVLATPTRTRSCSRARAIAAVIPAIIAAWLSYLAVVVLAAALLGARLTEVMIEPAWLGAVFAFGPAIGLGSVTAGLLVSSRVNDPRAAQQIGAVILLPLIAIIVVIQAVSGFLFGAQQYVIAAILTTIVGVAGLRLANRLFGRETILTRWR